MGIWMSNWMLPSWFLSMLRDRDDDLVQIVIQRAARGDHQIFPADPSNLGRPGLLHRRDSKVQNPGYKRPGVVLAQWDGGGGGNVGRDQDGVLDVRPHGACRLEGGDCSSGGVDGEAKGSCHVVCACDRSDGTYQASGRNDGSLRSRREQERVLVVGRDIDLLVERHDYGTLKDYSGGGDVGQ